MESLHSYLLSSVRRRKYNVVNFIILATDYLAGQDFLARKNLSPIRYSIQGPLDSIVLKCLQTPYTAEPLCQGQHLLTCMDRKNLINVTKVSFESSALNQSEDFFFSTTKDQGLSQETKSLN